MISVGTMLAHMELGVKTARRGWLTREQVVNTRPVSRIRKKSRKGA